MKRILFWLICYKVDAHGALLTLTYGRIKATKKNTERQLPCIISIIPPQNRIEKRPVSAAFIWSRSILAPEYEKADCARVFARLPQPNRRNPRHIVDCFGTGKKYDYPARVTLTNFTELTRFVPDLTSGSLYTRVVKSSARLMHKRAKSIEETAAYVDL